MTQFNNKDHIHMYILLAKQAYQFPVMNTRYYKFMHHHLNIFTI